MKYLRELLWGILLAGLCFVICKSQNDKDITDAGRIGSLSKEKAGQYVLIYNVDIIFTDEGEIYFKPTSEYYWEEAGSYKKGKNDKDFSGLYAGFVVTNVKKVVIYIDGNEKKYLYYEESENSITISIDGYWSMEAHDPECTDDEDCEEANPTPPAGFKWYCIDGKCMMG